MGEGAGLIVPCELTVSDLCLLKVSNPCAAEARDVDVPEEQLVTQIPS